LDRKETVPEKTVFKTLTFIQLGIEENQPSELVALELIRGCVPGDRTLCGVDGAFSKTSVSPLSLLCISVIALMSGKRKKEIATIRKKKKLPSTSAPSKKSEEKKHEKKHEKKQTTTNFKPEVLPIVKKTKPLVGDVCSISSVPFYFF
jgi:hypothetical protein